MCQLVKYSRDYYLIESTRTCPLCEERTDFIRLLQREEEEAEITAFVKEEELPGDLAGYLFDTYPRWRPIEKKRGAFCANHCSHCLKPVAERVIMNDFNDLAPASLFYLFMVSESETSTDMFPVHTCSVALLEALVDREVNHERN